jgi:photosystem II stability/assembly factor-like uncharacterized protein
MTVTYQSPRSLVMVKGQALTQVIACRVTRGWDQAIATAEVDLAWPIPGVVGHRTMIWIYMGITSLKLRFAGYITSINDSIYPGRITLGCEDVLCLAKYNKTLATYTLADLTDEAAIKFILETVGMPRYNPDFIIGTGKVIGSNQENAALSWAPTESALSKIQAIDGISVYDIESGARKGIYRTYADISGNIRRIALDPLPFSTAAHTFTEGDDIESGFGRIEAVEPTTTTMAVGYGGASATSDPTTNPYAVISNPSFELYPMIEEGLSSEDKHNLQEMADYLNQQRSYNIIRGEIVTRREDVIASHETLYVDSSHARVKLFAHLQSCVTEQNEQGGFLQQIAYVSYRELNAFEGTGPAGETIGATTEDNPFTDEEIEPDEIDLPEPEDPVTASFSVSVLDVETVLVDGQQVLLYTVACTATSQSASGTIEQNAWTAVGGEPTSGEGEVFNVNFPSLAGATVELVSTDSNADSGTTGPIDMAGEIGATKKSRKLYTAEGSVLADFDTSLWRTKPATTLASIVAHGPFWGDQDKLWTSEDDFVTEPTFTVPFPGSKITAIWCELDVSKTRVAVGTENGEVAVSDDKGATWSVKASPATSAAIKQIIISRGNESQYWALTEGGIFISDDAGGAWRILRLAADGQVFTCLRLTNFRNVVGSHAGPAPLERAEPPGDPFTFPVGAGNIVGVAANIFADELACVDTSVPPKLYVTEEVGSWNMVPAETPDLTDYAGAAIEVDNVMHHDSGIAGMMYVAVKEWILKTTNFWKAGTIYALRHIGEGGAGSYLYHIGVGEFGDPTAAPVAGRVYVMGEDALYRSDDAVTFTVIVPMGFGVFDVRGTTVLAVFGSGDVRRSVDGGDTWTTVATPSGWTVGHAALSITMLSTTSAVVLNSENKVWYTTDAGDSWTAGTPSPIMARLSSGSTKLWYSDASLPPLSGFRANPDTTGVETFAMGSKVVDVHAVNDTLAYFFRNSIVFGLDGATPTIQRVNGSTVDDITPPGALADQPWVDCASPDGVTIIAFIMNTLGDNALGSIGQLWRSADSGATWTKVLEDPTLMVLVAESRTIDFDEADPTHWYCLGEVYDYDLGNDVGDAVLWSSSDSGVTWTSAVIAAGERRLRAVRTAHGSA